MNHPQQRVSRPLPGEELAGEELAGEELAGEELAGGIEVERQPTTAAKRNDAEIYRSPVTSSSRSPLSAKGEANDSRGPD